MLVIGLTGGIGSGKSAVSKIFHETFSTPIVDADIIAKELTNNIDVLDKLYVHLGAEFFNKDKTLIRDKLRQSVFKDPELRGKLENILHPLVFKEIENNIKRLDSAYCITVIPLLLEKNKSDFVDRILVVDCTIEEQIDRVIKRDNCTEYEVQAIIETQISREERLTLADDTIKNSGSISELEEPVAELHNKYIRLGT